MTIKKVHDIGETSFEGAVSDDKKAKAVQDPATTELLI